MKIKIFTVLLIIALIIVAWFAGVRDYLSLEKLKEDSVILQAMVADHYVKSAFLYILLYIAITMLFMPFVSLVTLGGGFLFGTFWGSVYTNIGATIGSTVAFLLVRYFFGTYVQDRYAVQLTRFNRHMQEGQVSYLLAIHFISIIPFPIINLLAALTRVPLWTFIWTTSVGIFPGSLVYAFAGQQLTTIHSIRDVFSLNIMIAFVLLTLLAVFPLL